MRNNDFVGRSLAGALSFMKESLFSDEYAGKKGFLQSLDPRVKCISFALFLITVLFIKNIILCVWMYALSLFMAALSGVNIRFFLKRTWIFIPLFSLCIALPAIFNIFTPGETLFQFSFAGADIIVTRPGFLGAVLFVVRVATSVSYVVLLSITTRHYALLKALTIFGVPDIFVMTIGMCYRYIYLFVDVVEKTYVAIKSRVGRVVHTAHGRSVVAWNIALLWKRSYQLQSAVYDAMRSRGYSGTASTFDEFKINGRDWAWCVAAICVCGVTIWAAQFLS